MRERKNVNKKILKKSSKCKICGEEDYDLLDVHRIVPASDLGTYSIGNSVCLCVSCHRKIHTGKIKTLRWANSTAGKKLHIINEDGEEDFI